MEWFKCGLEELLGIAIFEPKFKSKKMISRWSDEEAKAFENNPLAMRVYTSRLLGQDEDLVLHGGGNTSVKVKENDLFGDPIDLLYVKGSGWDLGTIEAAGFAPVKMDVLLRMAQLDELSDTDMVKYQRAAMTNPSAPNPSVEAILHAIIPFQFVDHTHTDAMVTITNTPNGESLIREVYGDRVLYIPYVMPGFILAKEIYEMTKDIDWSKYEGLALMNHGLFTFNDDAKASYEKMIELVTVAEHFLQSKGVCVAESNQEGEIDLIKLATIRKEVSQTIGCSVVVTSDFSPKSRGFSALPNVANIATRGPITPDHIIRTKRCAAVINANDIAGSIKSFVLDYKRYFNENTSGIETMLDVAPRWAVWPNVGTLAFGKSVKEANIIHDIKRHTIKAIQQAEDLGGWQALPEKDLFEMEYWELEQAKLKKAGTSLPLQGKVALVTGAASGIGKACVEELLSEGAVVVALDLDSKVEDMFDNTKVVGVVGDVSDESVLENAVNYAVLNYGGLDIVVSNAGIFPPSAKIEGLGSELWQKSLDINLTSHQNLLRLAAPYLRLGNESAVVFIGSKNVPAPGPGAAAYSVAKAGLAQLARIAALELGEAGIRINTVHPNAVYDTAIWTEEVLEARAKYYGLSVTEYKTNNVLKTEVRSIDVAKVVTAMAGPLFGKITGAQLPIDGGNDRVI